MYNRFLAQAFAGKSEANHRFLAGTFTWGAYLLLGGIPLMVVIFAMMATDPSFLEEYQSNPFDMMSLGIPPFLMFVSVMLSFVIGMAGLILGVRWLQKRHLRSIITSYAKVRWGRMLGALGLWGLLAGVGMLITELTHPGIIVVNPDAADLLWFAPVALILIPIQSAFEEMAIRGQLMQNLSRRFTLPLFPLLLTSLLFALLHGMNNEVAEFGFLRMMMYYFSFGFFLGMFTLMDEGLEIAMGIHIGNNLFAFLFLSYPGAALETPSLFQQISMSQNLDFGIFLGSMVIVTMIYFGRKPQNYRALWVNEPINPYDGDEPAVELNHESEN